MFARAKFPCSLVSSSALTSLTIVSLPLTRRRPAAKSVSGVSALFEVLPADCKAQLSKVAQTCSSDSDADADDPDMTSLSTKDGCCLAPCSKAMQEVSGGSGSREQARDSYITFTSKVFALPEGGRDYDTRDMTGA